MTQWEQLTVLAQLKFDKEVAKLAELNKAQADISRRRSDLNNLNDQAKSALYEVGPAHNHNGDVHWQGWIGRNKTELGLEEARLRAILQSKLPELQRAFGRLQVSKQLQQEDLDARRKSP